MFRSDFLALEVLSGLACLPGLPPKGKKAWCWASYLEEEKAVAVPAKLFKEVQTLLEGIVHEGKGAAMLVWN